MIAIHGLRPAVCTPSIVQYLDLSPSLPENLWHTKYFELCMHTEWRLVPVLPLVRNESMRGKGGKRAMESCALLGLGVACRGVLAFGQ